MEQQGREDYGNSHSNPTTQFCLSWANFESHMISQLSALHKEETFMDVTLACEGRKIKAHRMVLSVSSPYLHSLLQESGESYPIIILNNMPWMHVVWLLQFMYNGEVNVPKETLQDFLDTAELLQIVGLSKDMLSEGQTTTLERTRYHSNRGGGGSSKSILKTPSPPSSSSSPTKVKISVHSDEEQDSLTDQHSMNGHAYLMDQKSPVHNMMHHSSHHSNNEMFFHPSGPSMHHFSGQRSLHASSSLQVSGPLNIPGTPLNPGQHKKSRKHGMVFNSLSTVDLRNPAHSLAPRPCPHCGKVYSNQSNLRQHMSLVHSKSMPVFCPLCEKPFKSQLYLRRHLLCSHRMAPTKSETSNMANWGGTTLSEVSMAVDSLQLLHQHHPQLGTSLVETSVRNSDQPTTSQLVGS